MLRWLVILSLVWQPLTLQSIIASRGAAECREPSCCRVIETVTCCGQVISEDVCGRSGGECRCAVAAGDSKPAPPAPRPRSGDDVAAVVPAAMPVAAVAPPRTVRVFGPAVAAVPATSHNRARALLGNWRT